jgi:glucosamine-6-phosphate deaminase
MTANALILEKTADQLGVYVYATRKDMGNAAGKNVAESLKRLLAAQDQVCVAFAAAPSQNEFLAALSSAAGIDWSRVVAFHLDEYIGLPENAPQRFSNYLNEHIYSLVPIGTIHYINASAVDAQAECDRYSALLAANPLDIACIGIGENGHLAFNDPPVADFKDPKVVKPVELDSRCRQQQVNDGCFKQIEDVPTHALTMTIPAIMAAKEVHCIVPGPTKVDAVKGTIYGEISTKCPASILRTHASARLYVDKDAMGI